MYLNMPILIKSVRFSFEASLYTSLVCISCRHRQCDIGSQLVLRGHRDTDKPCYSMFSGDLCIEWRGRAGKQPTTHSWYFQENWEWGNRGQIVRDLRGRSFQLGIPSRMTGVTRFPPMCFFRSQLSWTQFESRPFPNSQVVLDAYWL